MRKRDAVSARSDIRYLSRPRLVNMGDDWFAVSEVDHFWIQRRFRVLTRLCGDLLDRSRALAEVGCGHGLVQRQFEDRLQRQVDGYDLNEAALRQNLSRKSRLFCYDVLDRSEEVRGRYDGLLMLDVIEHIASEDEFLEGVLHMLAERGVVVINVPALMSMFSQYDVAAGHQRRYNRKSLHDLARRNHLDVVRETYWGLPFVPLLLARYLLLARGGTKDVIKRGFDPPGRIVNRILGALGRLEPIPHRLSGTSLMCVVRPQSR